MPSERLTKGHPIMAVGKDPRPGLAILFNGLTPYNVHFCKRLAQEIEQFKLHTIFTHSKSPWTIDLPPGANVVHFDRGDGDATSGWGGFHLQDLSRARRVLRHLHGHDVRALINCGYASLMHLRIIRLCRRGGIFVFLRGDSNICGDRPCGFLKSWLKRRVVRWAIRHCHGVMPMGEYGHRYFQKYGADAERCYLVPFEPDYAVFSQADSNAVDAFRRRHGLDTGRRYLFFSGRLVPVKRVDLLIEAFVALADRRPDWDLLIAGDGPLAKSLAARVPPLLRARVKWLGFCEVDQLKLAYHAAHVLVLPSDYEPWAVVINEAAAVGLVIVASDVVGAARQLVRDRVNGRIFRAGHLDELTDSLIDVTDPPKHEAYRQQVGPVLASWREQADPVEGVRDALRSVGVLDAEPAKSTS